MFTGKCKRGISISPSFLSWVEVGGALSQPAINSSSIEPLPEGLVIPSFARENVSDPSALKELINKTIPSGKKNGTISLTIPDAALKISFLDFDELPRKREEVERLILWRIKKSIPFAPELAKVDYLINQNEDGGVDVIAAVASRKVVREYEKLLIDIGLKPKIVDVSLMNLLNFFTDQLAGNFMFLTVNHRSISIAVVAKGQVKLFRYKEIEVKEDRIIKEAFATMTFFKSNFPGSSLDGAYLFFQTEKINGTLAERLGSSFEGKVSILNMASVLGQSEDESIPDSMAAAIGGAFRL